MLLGKTIAVYCGDNRYNTHKHVYTLCQNAEYFNVKAGDI
jgi:hypothetical protein